MHISPRSSWAVPLASALLVSSCIGRRVVYPVLPTPEELAVFLAAGPERPDPGADELAVLNVSSGRYRLIPGDLLEIQLPERAVGIDTDADTTVKSRVSREGTIKMPLVGEVEVGGKSLPEVEDVLVELYKPNLAEEPNIVAVVSEYSTVSVAVLGAVKNPGVIDLRSDRRSVIGAIMEAGGIDGSRGASAIRVSGVGRSDTAVLPIREENIPFRDLELVGGETVVVEPLNEVEFTVTGLVRKPGAFPYPRHVQYNLMQALAVAGGVDGTAAPRFASVYRKATSGEIIGATFQIDGLALTSSSNIPIKPGDVVAVEHTEGSWMRQFLSDVLGFRATFATTNVAR